MHKAAKLIMIPLFALTIASCARNPNNAQADPLQGYNRVVFAFNRGLDNLFLRPAAMLWKHLTPPPLQTGIANVFANIYEVTIIPNDILQGKIGYAFHDFARLLVNTTLGIGGLFDVASKIGLKKHYEDFGLTLAYWSGGKLSPYFEVPFFGPFTMREAFGAPFDIAMSPWPYFRRQNFDIWVQGIRYVNKRTFYLDADRLLKEAFDPYVFMRNAYLQRRNRLIRENQINKSPRDMKTLQAKLTQEPLDTNFQLPPVKGEEANNQPAPKIAKQKSKVLTAQHTKKQKKLVK